MAQFLRLHSECCHGRTERNRTSDHCASTKEQALKAKNSRQQAKLVCRVCHCEVSEDTHRNAHEVQSVRCCIVGFSDVCAQRTSIPRDASTQRSGCQAHPVKVHADTDTSTTSYLHLQCPCACVNQPTLTNPNDNDNDNDNDTLK